MSSLRVVGAAFRAHLQITMRSRATMIYLVVVPLVYATIAFFMFRAGGSREAVLWIALGAGLMGIWSSTLTGSGMALQRERWAGTFELVVAAPPPLVYILAGITIGTAAVGLYSLVATLAWGAALFDMPLAVEHPVQFALAVPATVLTLGLLGLLMASTFILYRQTYALTNLLEYPIWLVAGLLVPLSLLPGWLHPVSWAIGPTWGVRAIRDAALGGDPLPELALCLALAPVYLALGALCLHYVERRARANATLALT